MSRRPRTPRPSRAARRRLLCTIGLVLAAAGTTACAGGRLASVGPADIGPLRAAIEADPTDGVSTLRLAAALQAGGECGEAIEVAVLGMELRPQDALGPLVVGACSEERGDLNGALSAYEAFAAEYRGSPGAPAVEARAMLVRREIGARSARELLANETGLGTVASDPDVLTVMPIEIVGDEAYAALSLGLAAMITSDLGLIPSFRLVERSEVSGVLREIELAQAGRLDPRSAVEAGRFVRAGRVVHGVTLVAEDERLRFDATVTDPNGRTLGAHSESGRLRELLQMEKDLVVALIAELGYPLSESERAAILENGTENLAAFLAYSQGLLEQDLGNYSAAEEQFARAVQQDPAFAQARVEHRISVGAAALQGASPSSVGLAGLSAPDPVTPASEVSLTSALTSGPRELAPNMAEGLTATAQPQSVGLTTTFSPPPAVTGVLTQLVNFGFRLVLIFP